MSHEAPLAIGWLSPVVTDPQESTPTWLPLISCHCTCDCNKARACPLYWSLYWPYISAGCQCRGLHPERLEKAETTRWEDRQEGMHLLKTVQYRIYLKSASCRLIAQLIKSAFPPYPQKIKKIMLNWVCLGFRLLVEQKWYQEVNLGSGKKWKAYSYSFIPDKINKGIRSAL